MLRLLRQNIPSCLCFVCPLRVVLGELIRQKTAFPMLLMMLKVRVVAPCVSAGPGGKEVSSQLLPVSNATRELQATMLRTNLSKSADVAASAELAFIASVPPVG